MKNCNKISQTCGETTYATCIRYEGEVNEASELESNSCNSLEQTTQDIYNQLENNLNLSALGDECLTYTLEEGKLFVKNVLLKLEQEICTLKTKVEQLENRQICDMPVGDCVDFLCLQGVCDNDIITFGDWMNAVTLRLCD